MRKFLVGLFSVGAIALSPVVVQAQSFDPFPAGECPGIVSSRVCYDRLPSGEPLLSTIPSGFDGRFSLTGLRIADNQNVFFMLNIQTEEIVAYVYINDEGKIISSPASVGIPSVDNPDLLSQVTEEIVHILGKLML